MLIKWKTGRADQTVKNCENKKTEARKYCISKLCRILKMTDNKIEKEEI